MHEADRHAASARGGWSRPPIAIALPLKDEAAHIVRCVAALDRAAAPYPGQVTLVAFANDCRDDSVGLLRAFRPQALTLDIRDATLLPGYRNAGWARRLAMDAAADRLETQPLGAAGILLSTDADSRVAPDWLLRSVRYLESGYDAVAGLALTETAERSAMGGAARERLNLLGKYYACLAYLRSHAQPPSPAVHAEPWPHHDYEGGASIALSLALYRRMGGAPTPPVGEDRALFEAVRRHGGRVRHAIDVKVFTSCRVEGRAPGGMADTLRLWIQQDADAPVHETYGVEAILAGPAEQGLHRPVSFRSLPAELARAQRLIRAHRSAASVRPAP